MELSAIIVDDEEKARNSLFHSLKTHCPEIKVSYLAKGADEAISWLKNNEASILFTDISMPGKDGFEILPYITLKTAIIVVSGYEKFAIRAMRASAVDFLLKPVEPAELLAAVQRARNWIEEKALLESALVTRENLTQSLRENLNDSGVLKKLNIPTPTGYSLVDVSSIIFMEADGNYTDFYLVTGKKAKTSNNIGEYEDMLAGSFFLRIHRSVMVNMNHVIGAEVKEGCHYAILQNGQKLEISRRRLSEFHAMTKWGKGGLRC